MKTSKQRKIVSVSDLVGVSIKKFEKTGAFNIILGIDTRLFIDPFLLSKSSAKELKSSRPLFLKHFSKIIKLLKLSNSKADRTWKEADKLLRFPEAKGFNLGYGKEGSSGSGMGKVIRSQILSTAAEIVDKGIIDPEIFELVGLFEEGVGADRISDMVCVILENKFYEYSDRVYNEMGANNLINWKYGMETFLLPKNPFKNEPVILVPSDILRELPVAYDYDDISNVCRTNAELRDRVNQLIGEYWSDETKRMPKPELKRLLLENPEILKELLDVYKLSKPLAYDIEADPRDFNSSYKAAKLVAKNNPLSLSMITSKQTEILDLVLKICERFKDNIENRDLWKELYKDTECAKPRTEKTAQRLFYVIAAEHCDANGLDLTPESNAGRGPVDFKLTDGQSRVLVEIKLAHNDKLIHAYDTQVPLYKKAERTKDAIILIIKVKEKNPKLKDLIDKTQDKSRAQPKVLIIDGLPKESASKA